MKRGASPSNPSAIGHVGVDHLAGSLKALPIDGVPPTPAEDRAGRYPLNRPLRLLTGSLAHDGLGFVLRPAGQPLVEADGWLPIRYYSPHASGTLPRAGCAPLCDMSLVDGNRRSHKNTG